MISLPSKPEIVREDANRAVIEIEGLYPGYGHTIGNSMRRVLLSSLKGAAITSIKIEGAGHEFTTIDGVMEDVVDLTLNIKQLRFRLHEEGPFTISLSVSGEREVTGADFTMPSQVELVSPDIHIATLTSKKARMTLEAVVESGLGYVPVEARSKDKVEVGTIALDAAFSPVRHVNYEVENMRVGDRTDYHRLRLIVETDGSITPREAFTRASEILTDQFGAIKPSGAKAEGEPEAETSGETDVPTKKAIDPAKVKIADSGLSARTASLLADGGIKTVGALAKKTEAKLMGLEGLGENGIEEIKEYLASVGLSLKK